VEFEDVVSAVEGAEKRHFQAACVRRLDEIRLPLGFFPGIGLSLEAAVDDFHAAVLPQAVGGSNLGQAALEAMVEAGNFVPCAEVALELEAGDGLDALRNAGTTAEQRADRQSKKRANPGRQL